MSQYHSIAVLTGAGVSAESGLKTFRDANGLWENHAIEDVCTPEGFEADPSLVYTFYNQRRAQLINEARPNPAHVELAEFQQRFSGEFTLITQNVDNLHEQAGSKNVLHMHGELLSARCINSGKAYPWQQELNHQSVCPECNTAGHLRPDIVWFGEIPMHMELIEQALTKCDLFIAIGTSGQVYPAAGFVQLANACGAHCVELNLEPSESNWRFHERHYGPASKVVKTFLEQIL